MSLLFEGAIATKAAIEGNKRHVIEVIIDKKRIDRDCAYIKRIARNRNIPIRIVDKEEITKMATKSTHGGIVSIVDERSFQSLDDVLDLESPFLCILEGIEDPYNFANALRSLYAAGCDGVIVPPRNWSSADDVISKASGGASEFINLIVAEDFNECLERLKAHDIKILCAQRTDDSVSYYDADLKQKICICIGGEMRGLSKVIIKQNDQSIYIPYGSSFRNSLTAASSSAILSFEVLRQRKTK